MVVLFFLFFFRRLRLDNGIVVPWVIMNVLLSINGRNCYINTNYVLILTLTLFLTCLTSANTKDVKVECEN